MLLAKVNLTAEPAGRTQEVPNIPNTIMEKTMTNMIKMNRITVISVTTTMKEEIKETKRLLIGLQTNKIEHSFRLKITTSRNTETKRTNMLLTRISS